MVADMRFGWQDVVIEAVIQKDRCLIVSPQNERKIVGIAIVLVTLISIGMLVTLIFSFLFSHVVI
jgi:hypothetical protein